MVFFFILSLFLRFLIIFLSLPFSNYDLNSYLLIGEKTSKLINIYQKNLALLHHPYLPLFLYLEGVAFSLRNHINPLVFIKIVINLFDLSNGYLIYFLTNKNKFLYYLYLINPVSILIFSFHGQFDAIPLFFIHLSIYYLIFKKNELLTAIFLSIAIVLKTWPIFFFFTFLKKIKRKKEFFYIIFFNLFLFTTFYVYLFNSDYLSIIKTIINYNSLFSHWGFGLIIKTVFFPNLSQPPIFIQKIFIFIFIIFFFLYSIKLLKNKNLIKIIYNQLIFFYCFTFGFAPQYLSWLIPFIFIIKPKEDHYILLSLITIFLILNYSQWLFLNNLPFKINQISSFILWLFFVKFWFTKKII